MSAEETQQNIFGRPENQRPAVSSRDMTPEPEKREDEAVNGKKTSVSELETLKFKNCKIDDYFVLGKYTLLVCILCEMMILCQLSNMMYMVYAGAAPLLVSCGSRTFRGNENSKDRCDFLKSTINRNGTCKPQLKAQFISVNMEFGYYCGTTKHVKQSISIQMTGVIVGSVIFGQLSDIYGRRKIMIVTLALCILFMLISSFASSLIWFTVWRFCANVANAGVIVIWNVFFIENLPTKDRFWIKSIISWSPNMVFYAIIAYLAGDWRTLTRTSAVLSIPALLLLAFLCESPRWLLQRGKLGDVKAAIMRIHQIDGRVCDVQLLDHILYKEGQRYLESRKKNKYSFIHLFYTRSLAGYTIAVSFSIFVTSIMLYSLIFNMEKLSGSLYWNNIIMGLLQYACNLVTGFVDFKFERIGRKSIHDVAQIVSSVAFAVCTLIYLSGYQVALSNFVRASTLSVLGMCSLLYTTNVLCTNELFPTCIRNVSFSFVQTWSRVGVVVSPLIFFLGDLWTPLPYLFMCVLTLTDLFLFRFNVTETKGTPLSDNMPEKDQQMSHDAICGDKNVELLLLKNGNDETAPKQDK